MIDDIFNALTWEMMRYPFGDYKIQDCGLKSVIKRPHSLINVKDEDGNVTAQRLEIVTTPFKKDDVKVSVLDDTLSVECGSENQTLGENEEIVYRGISAQSYSFSLRLAPNVDQSGITAENKDGVLKITLPIIKKEKPKSIEIKVD